VQALCANVHARKLTMGQWVKGQWVKWVEWVKWVKKYGGSRGSCDPLTRDY